MRTSPHLSALVQDRQVEPSLIEEVDLATLTPTPTAYIAIDRNRGDDNTGQPSQFRDQALSMPYATVSGVRRCFKNLSDRGIRDIQIVTRQDNT